MLEYAMLGCSALLYQFVWLPHYLAKWAAYDYDHMASNRKQEGLPPLPDWGNRAKRAQQNYVENFPPFAVVIVLLGLIDGFTTYTGIAATVFFLARLSHLLIYTVGFVYLRSTVYTFGLVSTLYLYYVLFVNLSS